MHLSRKIKLSQYDTERISLFSREVNKTTSNFYESRNQNNNDKKLQDHFNGKFAEQLTYLFLREELGIYITPPDYSIYTNKNKSFDKDLKAEVSKGKFINIHVKSFNEERSNFPRSWIFQWGNGISGSNCDHHIFYPEFPENDFISLVSIYPSTNEGRIVALPNLKVCHQYNLFEDPIKDSLKGHKKAIYYSSIKNKLCFNNNSLYWGLISEFTKW